MYQNIEQIIDEIINDKEFENLDVQEQKRVVLDEITNYIFKEGAKRRTKSKDNIYLILRELNNKSLNKGLINAILKTIAKIQKQEVRIERRSDGELRAFPVYTFHGDILDTLTIDENAIILEEAVSLLHTLEVRFMPDKEAKFKLRLNY